MRVDSGTLFKMLTSRVRLVCRFGAIFVLTSICVLLSDCGSGAQSGLGSPAPIPTPTPSAAASSLYTAGMVPQGAGFLDGFVIDPQTHGINAQGSIDYSVGTFPIGLVVDSQQLLFAALHQDVLGSQTSTLVTGFQRDRQGNLTMLSPLIIPNMTPTSLAVDPQSRFVYLLGFGTTTPMLVVMRPDSTSGGVMVTSSVAFAGINGLPVGLSAEPSGNFLYATFETSGIEQLAIHANGTMTDIGNTKLPNNASADAIFADTATLYVGSLTGGVYAFSTTGGVLTPIPGSPFKTNGEHVLAFIQSGGFLYVGSHSSGNPPNTATIFGFQIQGNGALSAIPGSPFQPALNSECFALLGSTLYVGDSTGIRMFSIDSTTGKLTLISSQGTFGSYLGCVVVP